MAVLQQQNRPARRRDASAGGLVLQRVQQVFDEFHQRFRCRWERHDSPPFPRRLARRLRPPITCSHFIETLSIEQFECTLQD